MANDGLDGVRRLLINVGKILPFVVCFIVLISYIENVYALTIEDYMYYDGYCVLNKKVSNFIGSIFEYNIQTLAVLVLISFAISTCIYNKLACLYLGINLLEKSYFDFELEPTTIYIICLANIIVAVYLTVKGITIFLKSAK